MRDVSNRSRLVPPKMACPAILSPERLLIPHALREQYVPLSAMRYAARAYLIAKRNPLAHPA